MATDLDVTTATWGTENVEPEDNTVANPAYRTTVARNTGFNYYTPKLMIHDSNYVVESTGGAWGTQTMSEFYSPIGKFAVYGKVHTTSVTGGGTVRVILDGTKIFELASASLWAGTTITFSGTVEPTSRGWLAGIYYTMPITSNDTSIGTASLYFAGI